MLALITRLHFKVKLIWCFSPFMHPWLDFGAETFHRASSTLSLEGCIVSTSIFCTKMGPYT